MNLRFPQALIRIDIADAAQHTLVQQQREFSVAIDSFDAAPGQVFFKRGRIIDKIRLAQRDRDDPPPENCLPQSSRYCLTSGSSGIKRESLQNSTAPPSMPFA